MTESWAVVDAYLNGLLIHEDPILAQTLTENRAAGLPPIDLAPNQGKLLQLLVRLRGARKVLEIGTLGGYSAIWISRGLPADGSIVTLEANPAHAAVARANIERAGIGDIVDLRVGPALETLPLLHAEGAGPFDLVFIDADKENSARYLEWALRLTVPGSVVVCDNVVRHGDVADAQTEDAAVRGTRDALRLFGGDPRLESTAVQTVGVKGWDGFALAVVR